MDRPTGRLTDPATCPGSRQLLARAPAWAAGATCPGSPPGIAAGSRGRPRPGAGVQGRGMGRRGSPPVKGQHVFISFGPDCFRRGSRATCPGQQAAGWIAAGSRGRPRPGGRIISARAAGRRGRVHFDGRQGRGAPGKRGRDRAHAYTREHKTRVRPLPLKKIFLFPVGEYLARKTGVFPHGPFFCAMLFTSQGKRPAGDGGKPPKKIPEKIFEKGLTNGVHRATIRNVDGVHRTQTTNDRRPTP